LAFDIKIHDDGLSSDGEIYSFCLDVCRITGNCHFYIVLIVTLWVNISSNPNLAMSNCYIQACRILAGGCSVISTVSRVRVKVTVMDQCVKGLMWYRCSIPTAE